MTEWFYELERRFESVTSESHFGAFANNSGIQRANHFAMAIRP